MSAAIRYSLFAIRSDDAHFALCNRDVSCARTQVISAVAAGRKVDALLGGLGDLYSVGPSTDRGGVTSELRA